MSYYTFNNCKYKNCGRQFHTLDDLIVHIEDTHIDFDPKVMEEAEKQKLQFIPMSWVLRFNRDGRKDNVKGRDEMINISHIKTEPPEIDPALLDNEEYYKNPHWLPGSSGIIDGTDPQKGKNKRFSCPIAGCTKRYKNPNGMKYHILNYHDIKGNLIKPKKEHKCHCGREYKTIRGLQSHMASHKDTTINPRPVMKMDHFKMRQTFPSLMPKINSNCMMTNMYPPVDNYGNLIIKSEDHQLNYPITRNILSKEVPTTNVHTQIYPNPYYTNYGCDNMNVYVKTE